MTLYKSPFVASLALSLVAIANAFKHEDDDEPEPASDEETQTILFALLITTFAGFAAFIGAFSIFCIKKEQIGVMPASLAFSSGVILHLALINLLAECREELSHTNSSVSAVKLYTLLCVMCGVLIALGMEYGFKQFGTDPHHHHDPMEVSEDSHSENVPVPNDNNSRAKTGIPLKSDDDEAVDCNKTDGESKKVAPRTNNDMSRVSYSVAFALILHHLPEGIATFISLYHNLQFGVLVTFALAIHDVPSGICISVPLYCATGSKKKPFYLCAIAAAVYPIGALIGWIVLETASESFIESFIGILFGITTGIMLHIALVELLPTALLSAHHLEKKGHKNITAITIGLIFAGLFVMNLSDILLSDMIYH